MSAALAFLAQALILAWLGPIPAQALAGAALVAFAIAALWRLRGLLNPHFDMVLIMLGWGGLGMLLPAVLTQTPVCHSSPWAMWAGMLTFSAWPVYRYARCLQTARAQGRLGRALLMDGLGMWAGMAATSALPAVAPWIHHAAMLVGMTLGMGVGMLAGRWLERVVPRPQVPANT